MFTVVTSGTALEAKRLSAAGKCFVDVGFWGGAVPGNRQHFAAMDAAGALGFKAFTISSLDYYPALSPRELNEAATTIADLGSMLLVHAESQEHLQEFA